MTVPSRHMSWLWARGHAEASESSEDRCASSSTSEVDRPGHQDEGSPEFTLWTTKKALDGRRLQRVIYLLRIINGGRFLCKRWDLQACEQVRERLQGSGSPWVECKRTRCLCLGETGQDPVRFAKMLVPRPMLLHEWALCATRCSSTNGRNALRRICVWLKESVCGEGGRRNATRPHKKCSRPTSKKATDSTRLGLETAREVGADLDP